MTYPKVLIAVTIAVLFPLRAAAELGGTASSLQNDQSRLRAMQRASPGNGYTVHELQTENGLTIREYVAGSGRIFAVTWSGPTLPDLPWLLGSYFPAFKDAAEMRRAAGIRGPVTIAQDDLVVQSGGRMRAFQGRAWVPSLLPPQVTIDEIQ